jgi:hypothetical protein
MENSMRLGTTFNIIDTEQGEKADIFPITMDERYLPVLQNRMRRTIEISVDTFGQFWMARPEDVIFGKLIAWDESQSSRHSADIFEMMVYYYLGGLGDAYQFDLDYLENRLTRLNPDTKSLWDLINQTAVEDAARLNGI